MQCLKREKLRPEDLLCGSPISCCVILIARLNPNLKAIAHSFAHDLCHQGTLRHCLPALAIDCRLVAVMPLVVTDDVVAISVIFVESFVGILDLTFLALFYDVVGIEHGLMLAFGVKAELLFTACVRLGG